jgi:hypothetical protein
VPANTQICEYPVPMSSSSMAQVSSNLTGQKKIIFIGPKFFDGLFTWLNFCMKASCAATLESSGCCRRREFVIGLILEI